MISLCGGFGGPTGASAPVTLSLDPPVALLRPKTTIIMTWSLSCDYMALMRKAEQMCMALYPSRIP